MSTHTLFDLLAGMSDAARAARGWERVALKRGDVLFEQGAPADSLFLVAQGGLSLCVDGKEISRIGPGDSLGEASAFYARERRGGTVTALEDSALFELGRSRLIEMRDTDPAAYGLILDAALTDATERLELMERRAWARSGDTAYADAWPRAPQDAPPPPMDFLQALRQMPLLLWSSGQILTDILNATRPRFVPAGHALFRTGDKGESMFLVADGEMALYRAAGKPGAVLGRGALVGGAGLVAGAERRATAVGRKDTWLLEIGAEAWGMSGAAGLALREATLTALGLQLRAANREYTQSATRKDSLSAILSDAALLEGWQAGDPLAGVGPEDLIAPPDLPERDADFERLCAMIRDGIIGREAAIDTPFGKRRLVYADYTASGRSLSFIEDFLRDRVMPLYANTHTEASASGLQTTHLREEARAAVAKSVNAGAADEVIFLGSGATAAINRIIDILGLRKGAADGAPVPEAERPVVFIGPYEHHSNILPWRHSRADVIEIPVDGRGELDLDALRAALESHADRPLRIGSFSAASNVTGLATPVDDVARLLHAHGALSFWDYAAAGPYVPIDMNPPGEGAHKDAIFISPHKFVGGPGTPGLLVLKKALVTSAVPTNPGGGTVDFVTATDSLYSASIADREESGTPAIIESIRCGLAFRLKDEAGAHRIHGMEQRFVRAAIDSWTQNFKIRVLGPLDAERISIISFLIRHGRGYLHYNFVVALLNDLFGLQARGGCSCAGPYGGRLFGLEDDAAEAYRDLAREGLSCYKPGWVRVNFNYFISEEEFRYILDAIHLVAIYGYAMLPQYEIDPQSGIWTHRGGATFRPASLGDLDLSGDTARWSRGVDLLGDDVLSAQLAEGRRILEAAAQGVPDPVDMPALSGKEARWRWFPLPGEQAAWLRHVNGAAERPETQAGPFREIA